MDPAPSNPVCPGCRQAMPNIRWNVTTPVALQPGGPPCALVTFVCVLCSTVLTCQLLPINVQAHPPVIIPGEKFRR